MSQREQGGWSEQELASTGSIQEPPGGHPDHPDDDDDGDAGEDGDDDDDDDDDDDTICTRPVVNCMTRGRAPPAEGSMNLKI